MCIYDALMRNDIEKLMRKHEIHSPLITLQIPILNIYAYICVIKHLKCNINEHGAIRIKYHDFHWQATQIL